MARKHMKIYNVARGYCHKIADTHIPHGAFYGRDKISYWYCINKKLYPLDTPTLEMYRLNPENNEWYLLIEQSDTVKLIVERATQAEWDMPIEESKFTGIHSISANMDKTVRRTKSHALKDASRAFWNRNENRNQLPLDMWESVAPMTYEEKVGKKRTNRPRWKKTQYTLASKPYLI